MYLLSPRINECRNRGFKENHKLTGHVTNIPFLGYALRCPMELSGFDASRFSSVPLSAWSNVFQLPSFLVESEGTYEPSYLYGCRYIFTGTNKRARPGGIGELRSCLCKNCSASVPWICPSELLPRWNRRDHSMKSFSSVRKLRLAPRWFIHAFCARFIRRRLFLSLSVAYTTVGFVMRSLCEVYVIYIRYPKRSNTSTRVGEQQLTFYTIFRIKYY